MDNTLQQGLVTTTEFGESDFGKRLNYSKPKYRDPFFAVCYIVHVIVVLAAGIYIWVKEYPEITSSSNTSTSTSTTYSPDDSTVDWTDFPFAGVVVAAFACILAGVLFGVCWLQVMKKFAGIIIKAMLFFNIGIWVAVGIVGIALGEDGLSLAIIGFIMAAFYSLWTWCIWRRIPFASALLGISGTIISKYQGTVIISLSVIVFNVLWLLIWASCAAAYYLTAAENQTTTCDEYDECTTTGGPSSVITFFLLVSMYWGFQVNKNISHTTTCGVAATWYFTTVIDHKPTPAAFKRTMTTSFGSVCLGSLIVAFLQALRAMLRSSRNGRSCLALVALCLLNCVERLIRYFNKYAYAQCAIYGTSFIQSAKATWNLFMTRGILALINDDLTGMAIMCGALIGGVVSAAVGYFVGAAFYGGGEYYPYIAIVLAVAGFFIGLIFCSCVLMVLASCVIALFVCFAEDPAAMNQNRPEEYNRLVEAKAEWANVYTTYGGARVQAVGPTMAVAPAQPVVYVQGQAPPQQQQPAQTYYAPQQQYQQPQQQPVTYVVQQPQQQPPPTSGY